MGQIKRRCSYKFCPKAESFTQNSHIAAIWNRELLECAPSPYEEASHNHSLTSIDPRGRGFLSDDSSSTSPQRIQNATRRRRVSSVYGRITDEHTHNWFPPVVKKKDEAEREKLKGREAVEHTTTFLAVRLSRLGR